MKSVHGEKEGRAEALVLRISEAKDHLDQANTIFNFVFLTLNGFTGFDDAKWDYKLEAMVNVSNILRGSTWETREEAIAKTSEEIALRRLPALLVVSLVSAVETCLEDLVEISLRYTVPELSVDERAKRADDAMKGGPKKYLPKVAEALGIAIAREKWTWFEELVATRNVLVHESEPVADERYVRQAGPDARVAAGEPVAVDNSYLTTRYALAGVSLLELIHQVDPSGTPAIEFP